MKQGLYVFSHLDNMEDIIELSQVVSLEKQEEIKKMITNTVDFEWHWKSTLAQNTPDTNPTYVDAPGFAHVFYNDHGITVPETYNTVLDVPIEAFKKVGISWNKMRYARSFFQLPLTTHSGMSNPHVDMPGEDHWVCLYYIKDADGDTVFFDKFNEHPNDTLYYEEYNVVKSVSPKQGNAVVFNGRRYHANILPRENTRFILNFNVQ